MCNSVILGQTVIEITTASLCDERTTPAYAGYHIRPTRHTGVLLIYQKPTNWWIREIAAPLNFAISADIQSNSVSSSLLAILRQTVTELCAYMPAAPVLRTCAHYLIAFCSRPEAATEVIYGRFVRLAVPGQCVKFRDHHFIFLQRFDPKAAFSTVF